MVLKENPFLGNHYLNYGRGHGVSSVKNQDEKPLLHSVLHGHQTFLHSCFCFQPLCASLSFCTHQPPRSSHTPLPPQTPWFPNRAMLMTDFAACAGTQPGHLLPGFWLASPTWAWHPALPLPHEEVNVSCHLLPHFG